MSRNATHARTALAACIGMASAIALADDFPLKPIRIITSEAGGGTDFSARLKLFGGLIEATVTRFQTKQENLNSGVDATVRDELNPLLAKPFTLAELSSHLARLAQRAN